jgi:hypothetical protein
MNFIQRVANVALLGPGACCILLFLFNIVRHGWAVHYLLLMALAVVLFAVVSFRASAKANLALHLPQA